MSVVETVEFVSQPCYCGAGRFVAVAFSPDHAYGSTTYRGRIECSVCVEQYCLRAHHWYDVRLYKRNDIKVSRFCANDKYQRIAALWQSNPVKTLRDQILGVLRQESTKVGKYRLLKERNLYRRPLPVFRRECENLEAVVQQIIIHNMDRFPSLEGVRKQQDAIRAEPIPPVPFEQLAAPRPKYI